MKTHLQISPAKAKALPVDRIHELLKSKDIDVEQKLDGFRWLMHLGGGLDRVYMTGRRVSKKTGLLSEKGLCVPQIWPSPKRIRELDYTVLDGEIMPPDGASFRDLAGIMNVEPDKAAARIKEIGCPQFYVFDILYNDGKDITKKSLGARKMYRDRVLNHLYPKSELVFPLLSLFDHLGERVKSSRKIAFYEQVVEDDGEGLIAKDLTSEYGKGWYKWKKYSTLDVVITGYTDAEHGITGKYDGLIGAVKISVYRGKKLVEIGQVSGMVDEMRKKISANPKKYLMTVLEVKAQEMAKDRLRHPRWGRPRPDANPKDCTWEKMIRDLKAGQKEGE